MENKRFILLSTKGNGHNSYVVENGEDFRLIPLTQGKFAIVDAEDYDFIFYHQSPSIEHSPINNQDI